MKIVVITGEESGDKLAASAIKELKKISNEPLKIFGIGCLLYTSPSPRDRQKWS